MGESLTYRKGELLFDQGDEGDSAFVTLSGAASVLINIGGEKREVAEIGPKQEPWSCLVQQCRVAD
jgi:CRP-like cAMP-binding protein